MREEPERSPFSLALAPAREGRAFPARSDADRPTPAGCAARRLSADVDISFWWNFCSQIRRRTMELERTAPMLKPDVRLAHADGTASDWEGLYDRLNYAEMEDRVARLTARLNGYVNAWRLSRPICFMGESVGGEIGIKSAGAHPTF
jgi:hypothetical protein